MISQELLISGGHHRAAPGRRGGYRVRQNGFERASGRGWPRRGGAHSRPSPCRRGSFPRRTPGGFRRAVEGEFHGRAVGADDRNGVFPLPAASPVLTSEARVVQFSIEAMSVTSPVLENWMSGLYACSESSAARGQHRRGCTAAKQVESLVHGFRVLISGIIVFRADERVGHHLAVREGPELVLPSWNFRSVWTRASNFFPSKVVTPS